MSRIVFGLAVIALLVGCEDEEAPTEPPTESKAAPASTDVRQAGDPLVLKPALLEFDEEIVKLAKEAGEQRKGFLLGGYEHSPKGMSPKRRAVVLYLVRPEAEPELARAGLFELAGTHVRAAGWAEEELSHLLASVLHWLKHPEVQGVAAQAAHTLTAAGVRSQTLIDPLIAVCRAEKTPPHHCAAALQSLEPAWQDEKVEAALLAAMKSESPQLRYQAAAVLEGIKTDKKLFWSRYAKPLAKLLADPHPIVQATAADSLRPWKQAPADLPADVTKALREALRKATQDETPVVRCAALRTLARLGEPRDVHLAMKQVTDEENCGPLPEYDFKNPVGAKLTIALRVPGRVQTAAMQAVWELAPEGKRPEGMKDEHGRFNVNQKADEALARFQSWYAKHKDELPGS